MADIESHFERIESAPHDAMYFMYLIDSVLRVRGTWETGTANDGSHVRMRYYRDLRVAIKHFPGFQCGTKDLMFVSHPWSVEPVLQICYDSMEGWKLQDYVEGPWLGHLDKIKLFPRLNWREVAAYDKEQPSHRELLNDIHNAAHMLAGKFGVCASDTEQAAGVQLQLSRSIITMIFRNKRACSLHILSNSSLPLFITDRVDDSWEIKTFQPDSWIDELFEVYQHTEDRKRHAETH